VTLSRVYIYVCVTSWQRSVHVGVVAVNRGLFLGSSSTLLLLSLRLKLSCHGGNPIISDADCRHAELLATQTRAVEPPSCAAAGHYVYAAVGEQPIELPPLQFQQRFGWFRTGVELTPRLKFDGAQIRHGQVASCTA